MLRFGPYDCGDRIGRADIVARLRVLRWLVQREAVEPDQFLPCKPISSL
jgi:hypothetical protein